jgi:hypothetical protein
MLTKYYLIIILLCATNLSAQQYDTLVIGEKIPGSATQQTGKYMLYWDMPDGKYRPVSLETRMVALLPFNNKPTWAFIQQYHKEKGMDADTTYFDESTLMPIAYRTSIQDAVPYRETIDFEKNVLKMKIIYADSVKSDEKNIPLNYFQAPMHDYVISRLPLKQGYTITFKTINAGKNYHEFYEKITVTGSEEIVVSDQQKIDCWIVENYNGFSKSVSWYSKKDHQFIKMKFGNAPKQVFWKVRMF